MSLKVKKNIFYTTLKFPMGRILLTRTEQGLSSVQFIRDGSPEKVISSVIENGSPGFLYNPPAFSKEKTLFRHYFSGEKVDFSSLELDLTFGTDFQKKVWLTARKIPYGKTQTYKQLALRLNHNGYRSIGQALGRNPLLIVIPCHRVISSDGKLGGFSAGLELKKFLLRLEKAKIPSKL